MSFGEDVVGASFLGNGKGAKMASKFGKAERAPGQKATRAPG